MGSSLRPGASVPLPPTLLHVPPPPLHRFNAPLCRCSARHIPGVRFAGIIHPGLIGTAPSHELLKIWNDRETALVENAPPTLVRGIVAWAQGSGSRPDQPGGTEGAGRRKRTCFAGRQLSAAVSG